MYHTLSEAAKVTGKSKTTLTRAIKSGKLSARKNDDGNYEIDPAELNRAFENTIAKKTAKDNKKKNTSTKTTSTKTTSTRNVDLEILQNKLESKEEQISLKDDLIEQLKAERDRVYGLITDQRDRSETTEEMLNKEIEALRDKVLSIEVEKQGLNQNVRKMRETAQEYADKYKRTSQVLREEKNKSWLQKLFG